MRRLDANDPIQDPPSLLSRLEPLTVNQLPKTLLQRVHPPDPKNELSLFERISTSSSTTVEEDRSQRRPPPRNCLSPWSESPHSRPTPERRRSYPTLLRSPPLIERIWKPLTLLERLSNPQPPAMKRRLSIENETPQISKRRRSLSDVRGRLSLRQNIPRSQVNIKLGINPAALSRYIPTNMCLPQGCRDRDNM